MPSRPGLAAVDWVHLRSGKSIPGAYPAVRTRQCVPGSHQTWVRTRQSPSFRCVPCSYQASGAYPAATKLPVRTLQPPSFRCVPCSAYPAVTKPRCVRAYPAVRHRMVPAVPARVRVRVVRTRQSSNLGAYPAVAPVRTRQCPPCSPKDGPRGLYAPPLLSTTFSQAKGHIRQAIHGFLGSLVGEARAAESWVRTLQ